MKKRTYSGQARRWRIERRTNLRYRGIKPCRVTMVYRVDVDEVPDWARLEAFEGLSSSETHVWLTRRSAKLLVRQMGGHATLTEVEYRRCPQCDRLLLGEDAALRRRQNESCATGEQLPCGTDCFTRQRRKMGKRAA